MKFNINKIRKMNKYQLQELANQKILTDVGFVSHHIEHEEDLKNLS